MSGCGEMILRTLNEKSADIESIYTSLDEEYVKELLEEYDVSYIFVGSKETGEIWGGTE